MPKSGQKAPTWRSGYQRMLTDAHSAAKKAESGDRAGAKKKVGKVISRMEQREREAKLPGAGRRGSLAEQRLAAEGGGARLARSAQRIKNAFDKEEGR